MSEQILKTHSGTYGELWYFLYAIAGCVGAVIPLAGTCGDDEARDVVSGVLEAIDRLAHQGADLAERARDLAAAQEAKEARS